MRRRQVICKAASGNLKGRKELTGADRGLVGINDLDIKGEHVEILAGLLVSNLVQDLGDGIKLVRQGSQLGGSTAQERGGIEDEVDGSVVGLIGSQERVAAAASLSSILGGDNVGGSGLLECSHYVECGVKKVLQ